jgi:regulatory protein
MSQQAFHYLVKILSTRDYSEHKLREKLIEKKYSASEIDSAINEIQIRGYLREDAYTKGRIQGFINKGLSINHIRQKLNQEHLEASDDKIQEMFNENQTSEDQQIERLARKKIGSKTDLKYEDQVKILRYLISKGHDYGISKRILGNLVDLKVDNNLYDS